MKAFKLSWASVMALALVFFYSCQKDVSGPMVTSAARSGGTQAGAPAFDLSLPDADVTCETSSTYCFNTSLLNNGGQLVGGKVTISAEIRNSLNEVVATSAELLANQGSVCFSDLGLVAGQYTVIAIYDHVPNENAQPQHGEFSFPLTVQAAADCGTTLCETTGLTFSRTPVIILDQNLKPIQVDVTYKVTNCSSDQTFNNLKIQGGLVNKATEPALSTAGTGLISSFTQKKNGGNFILTGYFSLAPGQYSDFKVKYLVQTACGNPMTGEWSVKNGPVPVISTDLATTNPYYVNRLQSVCP
jgi:hypothetical protein